MGVLENPVKIFLVVLIVSKHSWGVAEKVHLLKKLHYLKSYLLWAQL